MEFAIRKPLVWLQMGVGPLLLLRHDVITSILANGSAAFIESCAAVGWNNLDSVRML